MEAVLLYLPAEDESEYGVGLKEAKVERMEYWIGHGVILPVGMEIRFLDGVTRKDVIFRVIKQICYPESHRCDFLVAVKEESMVLSPEEFFHYMLTKWPYQK
jgi:hypothetical protein